MYAVHCKYISKLHKYIIYKQFISLCMKILTISIQPYFVSVMFIAPWLPFIIFPVAVIPSKHFQWGSSCSGRVPVCLLDHRMSVKQPLVCVAGKLLVCCG